MAISTAISLCSSRKTALGESKNSASNQGSKLFFRPYGLGFFIGKNLINRVNSVLNTELKYELNVGFKCRELGSQKLNKGVGLHTALIAFLSIVLSVGTYAQSEPISLEFGSGATTRELSLSIGRSQIIRTDRDLEQVVIGSPDIADIKLLSSRQVLILGIKPGITNLVFRDKKSSFIALMDVIVGYDLSGLKRKIYEVIPNEKEVEIRGSNDSVIISGRVSSSLALETVLEVARSFVPADKVVNTMSVGGGHQVMLEVQVAEINRKSVRDLGVGVNMSGGTDNPWSLITAPVAGGALGAFNMVADPGSLLNSFAVTVEALEQKGLAKLLAEPNLVALSGQEANFLAGGEFPIPVSNGNNNGTTIDYKEFGVGIRFKPTVLSEQKINLKLGAEVSAIDVANSVTVDGLASPAFSTRRTETTVEMSDGQSFAIAGLMQSDANNLINQYPLLGDLPVIGALFRSTNFQRSETELVIIVTVHLVKPVVAASLRNITDSYIPPNMLDQYLLGRLEGGLWFYRGDFSSGAKSNNNKTTKSETGLDGAYGHQVAGVN